MLLIFIIYKVTTKSLNRFDINSTINIYIIFTIFCGFSLYWSLDFETGFKRVITLVLITINIIVIYNILKKLNSYDSIFYGLFIGTFLNFLIGAGYLFSLNDYFSGWRFIGTTGNANIISTYMVLSIFASTLYLSIKNKGIIFYYYQYINIVFAFYIVIIAGSKKGIAFSVLFILLYLISKFTNPKEAVKTIGQVLFIIIFISYFSSYFIDLNSFSDVLIKILDRFSQFANAEGHSTETRLKLAIIAFDNLEMSPLFGTGIGSFLYKYNTYAHNNYLELLSEVGIFGFTIFYFIYFILLKRIYILAKSTYKIALFSFVGLFLLLDLAEVNYYSKFILFYLILLTYMIEKEEGNAII